MPLFLTKHLQITGRVQGVGYRASFEMEARALSLSGWVRNRVDGSVEAMIYGEPDAVQKMITWARRGPALAQVTDVSVNDASEQSVEKGNFKLLPTI
jgi:acylphosphatase